MTYNNAPIVEAVFEIRIDKIDLKQVDSLLQIKELASDIFPVIKERQIITNHFQVSNQEKIETKSNSAIGYVFGSIDEKMQLQVKVDGITLNIQKPYRTWDEHFDLFMRLWNFYSELFKPRNLTRISARFINRIELPLPFDQFEDYIVNMPPIPEGLPKNFSNFFMQTSIPCDEGKRLVILTETLEPVQPSVLPFILDIDVCQEFELNIDRESIISNFREIRNTKNLVFESCITDKTRALFYE